MKHATPRLTCWTRLGAALALLLATGPSSEARQRNRGPVVSVQLSTMVAKVGEPVVLKLTVENAREARLVDVPQAEGLVIGDPAGPFSSQYTQILNGRLSERIETSWRVPLRAGTEGDFEIPPFELLVDGQRMESKRVTLKVLRDLRGEDLGFFEIRPSSVKVVEGQPFTLELRFGWESAAEINFANFSLPWWGALPGTLELEREDDAAASGKVYVNEKLEVPVERLRDARGDRVVYRFARSFLPTRSGPIHFPTSFLEFGQLDRGGLFSGRRKLKSFFVRAPAFDLEVVPLPSEGQPFDYSGAVGTIDVRAAADTRDVVVGDSIKLTVDWSGEGNLEFFEAPDLGLLDAFRDFQVYGSTEDKAFDRRRVVYDLAPLSEDVDRIPAVPLTVFDPTRERYVSVETEPVPIRVRPLERPVELGEPDAERFERDIEDIDATPLAGTAPSSPLARVPALSDRVLVAGFAGTGALWLFLRVFLGRRRADPDAPLERRRRRARRELRRALRAADDPARSLAAFTTFLAARTREPDEAWTGRDPGAWRRAHASQAGTRDEETWRQAERLIERLEAGAYGAGEPVAGREVLAAADRLVRCGL